MDNNERIAAALERMARAFDRAYQRGRPGFSKLRITAEKAMRDGMADILTYEIDLPAETDVDVEKRRYTLKDSSGALVAEGESAGREAVAIGPFTGEQDSAVALSFVNVDDGNNESLPRDQTFILLDDIDPSQPGEAGLRVLREAESPPVV